MQQVETILAPEKVEIAFKNAKEWCRKNLCKHLEGYNNDFDFENIEIAINLNMIPDMAINDECRNTIFLNPNQIAWYISKENKMEELDFPRSVFFDDVNIDFRGGTPYDLESAFIHEIVEMVLRDCEGVLSIQMLKHGFAQQFTGIRHFTAWKIENINRIERDLLPWTLNG